MDADTMYPSQESFIALKIPPHAPTPPPPLPAARPPMLRNPLVVQWLRLHAPNAEAPGLTPVHGTRSHMPQLKILHAVTKPWCSQIKK